MDKLKRDLSELDVWSLALGAIIGWGCFVLPGNKFLNDAGPLGTAIALSIGALIMIFIARSYGVLIHRFPVAGGEFTSPMSASNVNMRSLRHGCWAYPT